MHPDYIDELVRREQQRDWQRTQEHAHLARAAQPGRANRFGLGRAIVKWLHARLTLARRQTGPTNKAQPRLTFKQ